MKNKTLSEEIVSVALNVIERWLKDNPRDSLLNVAQQINYAAVRIRTAGAACESDYKAGIRGKTTNTLH
jgi:hypothetical protein